MKLKTLMFLTAIVVLSLTACGNKDVVQSKTTESDGAFMESSAESNIGESETTLDYAIDETYTDTNGKEFKVVETLADGSARIEYLESETIAETEAETLNEAEYTDVSDTSEVANFKKKVEEFKSTYEIYRNRSDAQIDVTTVVEQIINDIDIAVGEDNEGLSTADREAFTAAMDVYTERMK